MKKLLLVLFLLGVSSSFAQIIETDPSIYNAMKELSKQHNGSPAVDEIKSEIEKKYSVKCAGDSYQFFPDITKKVKYSARCTNSSPNGVSIKIVSTFQYYLGQYHFELADYSISFFENKNGWIKGDVFQVNCGMDDENLNKVIGNKCIIFTDTAEDRYLGIIVDPNSKALYGGKLDQLKNISFPPMSENCFNGVSNKTQDRLSNLSATNTKYLNFNDSLERCWGGVSVTLGNP